MRLYLSGSINCDPIGAEIRFREGEKFLLPMYEVFNPYTYCEERGIVEWKECMKVLMPHLFDCDGIALLDTHNASVGRDIEVYIARKMLIPVRMLDEWRKN